MKAPTLRRSPAELRASAEQPLERLLDAGLICRADDRGDPVIEVSPPLILGTVLEEAWARVA